MILFWCSWKQGLKKSTSIETLALKPEWFGIQIGHHKQRLCSTSQWAAIVRNEGNGEKS